MKNNMRLPSVFLLIFIVLVASCTSNTKSDHKIDKVIYPQSSSDIPLASSATTEEAEIELTPRAPLPPSYLVLDIQILDLDTDGTIEQLITVKRPTIDGAIWLLIIDYDRQRNEYLRTWEGSVQATQAGSLQIEILDLTRDNTPEIVVRGINDAREQTMDIFAVRKIPIDSTIYLAPIGAFASTLAIHIEDFAPSQQSISPFVVTEQKINNSELLEFEQIFFAWDDERELFYEFSSNIVTNNELNIEFFELLLSMSNSELLSSLHGVWRLTSESEITGSDPDTSNENISFPIIELDKNQQVLNLSQNFSLETFMIDNWFKTILSGRPSLQLLLTHNTFRDINERAYITIISQNSIEVTITSNTSYNGRYQKYVEETETPPAYTFISEPLLSGWYYGSFDRKPIAIYFDDPYIIIQHDSQTESGSWFLYQTDRMVMEINIYDENRQYVDQRVFATRITSVATEGTTTNSVSLIPATINIQGVQLMEENEINVQQIISE